MSAASRPDGLCSSCPRQSLLPQRLSLQLFVPGFWLLALLFSDASRQLVPTQSAWLAPCLAVGFLAAGGLLRLPVPIGGSYEQLEATFTALNGLHLRPDARVYAYVLPEAWAVAFSSPERAEVP